MIFQAVFIPEGDDILFDLVIQLRTDHHRLVALTAIAVDTRIVAIQREAAIRALKSQAVAEGIVLPVYQIIGHPAIEAHQSLDA